MFSVKDTARYTTEYRPAADRLLDRTAQVYNGVQACAAEIAMARVGCRVGSGSL